MKIVDLGSGPPVVIVPGVQGRWEWYAPAVDALAQRCRIITFSLADEPSSGAPFDPARGFWSYVDQIHGVLDAAGVNSAVICGVSYGGPIAAAFAASHPERVASLILVSPLPPSWAPDPRVKFYLRAPRLLAPVFLVASLRLYREIAAAVPGVFHSARAGLQHAWRALTHMFSPSLMARRVALLTEARLQVSELGRLSVPTLLMLGEPSLDRVVPVRASREYLRIWPHARVETLQRTGHLGLVTRPAAFADLVAGFAKETCTPTASRRRIG